MLACFRLGLCALASGRQGLGSKALHSHLFLRTYGAARKYAQHRSTVEKDGLIAFYFLCDVARLELAHELELYHALDPDALHPDCCRALSDVDACEDCLLPSQVSANH